MISIADQSPYHNMIELLGDTTYLTFFLFGKMLTTYLTCYTIYMDR